MGGKTNREISFLKSHYPDSIYYDLLDTHEMVQFTKSPYLLREEILGLGKEKLEFPVIIDEIQKVPELLNEVHWLIENTAAQFILCGSSARQIKNQSTNLLGGRAWQSSLLSISFS